ncbi:MAG TPA: hypothetical protein PLM29_09605 [Deltaproteobacteria bacterium]|nr:hypothetical protein [Deltaproteobacteria bacterium]
MATENQSISTTIQALEDLRSYRYHAIALDDGKLANNAEEASGILLGKPNDDQFASIGYIGEMKYKAGAAITKGAKLTVTTSGWFTTAASNDTVVGEAKAAVTSGSLGTGLFSFPGATAKASFFTHQTSCDAAFLAGTAIHLVDRKQADNDLEADMIFNGAVTSGTLGTGILFGKSTLHMAPNQCCSLGDDLMITTSGYFIAVTSGNIMNAKALENISSNSTGAGFFYGTGGGMTNT